MIERHAELPSTMDRARDLAVAGAPAGTTVVTEHQTAGRGTHGRQWITPAGSCLTFTVIARPKFPPAELEHLPLKVANRVAAVLRERGLEPTIKPPNDILVGGRKICGILCTSHVQSDDVHWVLIGVGLNTFMTEEQLPLPTATSLAIEGIKVTGHPDLLNLLLKALAPLLH